MVRLLVTSLLLGAVSGAAPPAVFPFGGSGGGAPEDVACYRIPVMTTTSSGDLLAFAEARLLSCKDDGPKAIAMRRSEDNGASWADIRWIFRDPSNSSDYDGVNLGSVVTSSEGHLILHLVFGAHTLDVSPSGVLRSSDDGRTWSDPDYSQTPALSEAGVNMFSGGPGNGIRTGTGRLVVSGWYRGSSGQNANGSNLLLSDDDGQTWRMGAMLPIHPDGSSLAPNEADVALFANGTIVLSSRDGAKGGYRIISYSEDDGESLVGTHQALDLPDATCQGSLIATDNGATLYHLNAASKITRVYGVLHVSRNGGRTWQESQVVHAGVFAYSALVEVNSSHLVAMYETYNYIGEAGIAFAALEKDEGAAAVTI